MLPDIGHWLPIRDGDRRALALYRRHYSYRRKNAQRTRAQVLFCGPGEKMVLLTARCDALWVWRRSAYSTEEGIECAIFRNESPMTASLLIIEAVALARARWGGGRLFTYVNPRKLPPGKRPGYCFERAGWRRCGVSKGGLLIFEYSGGA